MSIRAYRINKIDTAAESSFNLSSDTALMDALYDADVSDGDAVHDERSGEAGIIEVHVQALEELLNTFPFEAGDYRKEAIKADITFACEKQNDYVMYQCF